MKSFYIKQKLISLRDNFHVYNEQDEEIYTIEGSFLRIPKRFIIRDQQFNERAVIERKVISLLPKFNVTVEGQYEFSIKKHFSFFKSRYSIEGEGIEVNGNLWDMDFDIMHKGQKIGTVNKAWLSLGDTYKIDVFEEPWEMVIITLVVAIDRVKEEKNSIASSVDINI